MRFACGRTAFEGEEVPDELRDWEYRYRVFRKVIMRSLRMMIGCMLVEISQRRGSQFLVSFGLSGDHPNQWHGGVLCATEFLCASE